MNNNHGATGLRPPPNRPNQERSRSITSVRSTSSLSSTSTEAQDAAQIATQRTAFPQAPQGRLASVSGTPASQSSLSLTNFSRPGFRAPNEEIMKPRPQQSNNGHTIGHRPRQHSQGFFEPSLSSTSASTLSASAIAAATAMNHLGPLMTGMHDRKKSLTSLSPDGTSAGLSRRVASPAVTSPTDHQGQPQRYYGSTPEDSRSTATTAANAAYPRNPMPTVNHVAFESSPLPPIPPPLPEKPREKPKMKLFSKPKAISTSRTDGDKKLPGLPGLPSPGKKLMLSGLTNPSVTSLLDNNASSASSMYSAGTNGSSSTLIPLSTSSTTSADKEKEKHRPHFLSRQKNKHNDRVLPLSSASSNSQAVDPSAPQSLYSFTPQSPGINSSFAKSMTGFDLRHGGKGLRDRRKEEKAAASLGMAMHGSTMNVNTEREFLGPSSLGTDSYLGGSGGISPSVFSHDQNPAASAAAFNNLGTHMGLSGITPDDAWPLLKARLLNIFEGQDIRTPVEDFNLLVAVHIRRCVHKRAPVVLVEDLRDFLQTGFGSLTQTLRTLPDERLVPNLVEMWQMIYCMVLPFIQAVFLPLDLEFRGRGTIMTTREAGEFWGAMLEQVRSEDRPGTTGETSKMPTLGEELDVRRMTLIAFRDIVIMPRHELLLTIFSRLSLDSINAGPSETMTNRSRGQSNPLMPGAERPGTSGSLSPRLSSYNSQASTLLDTTGSPSQAGISTNRSRATSNTSAGSFGTSLSHLPSPLHPPPQLHPKSATPPSTVASYLGQAHSRSRSAISVPEPNAASMLSSQGIAMQVSSAHVTETVARMLQCVSILAGVQTGDVGQSVIERLTGVLKHNWLGRGRTGRQRNGFVGMRVVGITSSKTLVGTA